MRLILLVIILVGVFCFTGAGQTIMTGLDALPEACSNSLGARAPKMAGPICNGLGSMIRAIDQSTAGFSEKIGKMVSDQTGHALSFGKQETMTQFSDEFRQMARFAEIPGGQGITSSVADLEAKLKRGASVANSDGASVRSATDDYVIGQRLLRGDDASASSSLSWFQQGASQQQYGVMSQVSLAEIYQHGSNGVPANNGLAQQYYSQALESLSGLDGSGSAESKQVIATLPGGSTAQLKQQILAAIQQLKTPAR